MEMSADSPCADQRYHKGLCSHCGWLIQARLDGNVKIHGPFKDRCPGSGSPPASNTSSSPTSGMTPPEDTYSASQPRVSFDVTDPDSLSSINPGPFRGKVIKRILKASRHQVASKLSDILNDVTTHNSAEAWKRLFLFPRRCLLAPKRGGRRGNLATQVNQALLDEVEPSNPSTAPSRPVNMTNFAARVSSKLEQGDFRGAVHIASSKDTFCIPDERSFKLLREKHPPAKPNASFPDLSTYDTPPPITSPITVRKAIQSFPEGSAGGHDGLLPQHLKDVISSSSQMSPSALLLALINFVNLVIRQGTHSSPCLLFRS